MGEATWAVEWKHICFLLICLVLDVFVVKIILFHAY